MIRAFSKTFLSRHSSLSFATKAVAVKKTKTTPLKKTQTTTTKKSQAAAVKPKATPKKKIASPPAKIRVKKVKQESKAPLYIQKEKSYSTNNYSPIEVVISRAKGLYVTDVDGKRYMDFLAAYSAVNQGHNHPKIISAMRKQIAKLSVVSNGFYHDLLAQTGEYLTGLFGYNKILMMNTGVEAVETCLKIARRWAYEVKGVEEDQARVLFCTGNFMGRTIAVIGASEEESRHKNFGPFRGMNFDLIEYNDLNMLERMLESNTNYAAFFVEPIQGEAGVIIPSKGYLKKAKALCKKYNVLLIADQIQTGLGRTGKLLASQWDNVKPDMITVGKALGGGVYPVSGVLANNSIMKVMTPGSHSTTFGGNPLACAVARASMEVLINENLVQNSLQLGQVMERELNNLDSPFLRARRNRGLMGAIQISPEMGGSAWDLCTIMKSKGMLAKPTHQHTIRLTPPLIIKEAELVRGIDKIQQSLNEHKRKTTKLTKKAMPDTHTAEQNVIEFEARAEAETLGDEETLEEEENQFEEEEEDMEE